ncbi:hypothetical protein RRG08_027954 [Elysia crispata]|uniref:Uncharacterized protein n=1 Tax=Elysia crispata TaxID=231223 RepID=A0AAE0ZKJ5_9GAST|nr:hypothetical protein RRG08_027954 [Elysia crispata]
MFQLAGILFWYSAKNINKAGSFHLYTSAAASSSSTIINTTRFDNSSGNFNIGLNITMNKILASIFVSLAVIHVVFSQRACTADGNACDGKIRHEDNLSGNRWCCPVDGETLRYAYDFRSGSGVYICICGTDAECAVPNSPCAGLRAVAAATSSTTIIKTSSFDNSSSGFNIRLTTSMNTIVATIFVSLALINVVFSSSACVKDVATANGSPCDGEVKVDDDMTGNTWCCPVDGEKARYEGGLVNGGGFFMCTCKTDAECAVPNSVCNGLETAD